MLFAASVMGVRWEAESRTMLCPWLARMSQSEGVVEVGCGVGFMVGLGFIEKRCLGEFKTASLISVRVAWRERRRGYFSFAGLVSNSLCFRLKLYI